MTDHVTELRPAWRNSWFGMSVAGFFLFIFLLGLLAGLLEGGEQGGEMAGAAMLFLSIGLVALGMVAFKRFTWKYTIDGSRVSCHYGIISRNQQSVRIKDLRSVELSQSLVQRLLNVGHIAFYSAGSASAEVIFKGVLDPARLRDQIDNTVDQLKDGSGE